MTARTTLLDLPVFEAVSLLVREQKGEAVAALDRTKDRRDVEALHDFRVAVRRLRSLLRAYQRWTGPAAGRKVRRALGDLASATNAGRDAEVQLAWLESQRATLRRGERSGLNWLVRRLRVAKRVGYDSARRHGREDFDQVCRRIDEKLREAPGSGPTLREVFAALLREHCAAVESGLASVRGSSDESAAHITRIAAKRLRYLLEPLRSESAGVKELIRSLKGLQDVLGDLHDMHVLDVQLASDLDEAATEKAHRLRDLALAGDQLTLARERRRDERFGLATLGARVQARRDELYAELEGSWITERAPALFRDAQALAETLAPRVASAPSERVAQPNEPIPMERERKYLLTRLPAEARNGNVLQIEQGWLPGRTLRERLRHVKQAEGEFFYRTIKLGSGIERIEIEEETTAAVFAAMWPLTENCRIEKRRYRVPYSDVVWEIDEFLDRDLVLAEVELTSVDQPVEMPDWLERVLVREVTDEPAYLNLTLATRAA